MGPQVPSIPERVVDAVARATDTDPLELPSLFEAVDPDALNALVREMVDGEVSFRYAGHSITVASDETVRLDPLGERTDGS